MKVDAMMEYKGHKPDVTQSQENKKFWNIKWYDPQFSEFHQFIVVGSQNAVPTWNKFVIDSRSSVTPLRWIKVNCRSFIESKVIPLLAKIGVR